MPDAVELSKYWKSRIERDLASFGDPGATVNVTGSRRRFRAEWTMRGIGREAMFSTSPDRGVSVDVGGRHLAYSAFFAGTDMADLPFVARMILQASNPRLYVPTKATRTAGGDTPPGPAIDLLTALLDQESDDATRVLMVTGAAGAGKTRVLQELVRRQAEDYIHGRTRRLLLYVNAQGRALARLNEALATELQDLKVGLTYHSVAVLAKLGILIPVIDGFDELLGVSGYDDAFSSLAGFLEQLEGEGQLLTSARSVYYEEEFLARAGSMSTAGNQAWSHDAVRVLEWSDEDREDYLDQWAEDEGLSEAESTALRKRVHEVFDDRNAALASKPLFFTRIVELLRRNPDFSGGDDLLEALVHEYLSRERTEKLLDSQSGFLLTEDQFERLMCELAEEMWNQETRELDSHSVREVAEYVVEDEGLSDVAKRVIVERMPTLAFLARGDSPAAHAGIAFEHELFFFYFLAGSIVSQFASVHTDVQVVLSRSALPEDIAERVAIALGASEGEGTPERLQKLLDRLAEAGAKEWRRTTQVRENAGLLVMALLREYACADEDGREIEECMVRSVVFPGSNLNDVTLRRCSLIDVTFRRTDLARTRFVDCEARNVMFFGPRVAPDFTRLELNGIETEHVIGIRAPHGDSMETTYDPSSVATTLRACGAPIRTDLQRPGPGVSEDDMRLLERLMRAYRRANPVCMADPNLKEIFTDPGWNTIEHLLVEHDIVKKESRRTSGKPKKFLRRRFRPEQIMAGLYEHTPADPQIRAFWRALALESEPAASQHSP